MAHQFQDLEDKENERRKAMGLPPVSWDDLYRQEREFLSSQPRRRKSTRAIAKESTASVGDSSPLLNSALQGIEKKLNEDERTKSQDRIRRNKDLEKTEALGASLEGLSRSTAESIDLLEELLRLVKSGEFGRNSRGRRNIFEDSSALGFMIASGAGAALLAGRAILNSVGDGSEQTPEIATTAATVPGAADVNALGLTPEVPTAIPQVPTAPQAVSVPQVPQVPTVNNTNLNEYNLPTSQNVSMLTVRKETSGSNVVKDPVIPRDLISPDQVNLSRPTQQQKTPISGSMPRRPAGAMLTEPGAETVMRELTLKARKITFSGDEIRLGKISDNLAGVSPVAMPGLSKDLTRTAVIPKIMGMVAGGAASGSGPMISATGDTSATADGEPTETPTVQQLAGGQTESASDLKFAPGVDPRIKESIASKVKKIESDVGKDLLITSGFRDPQRNAAVGGARNSAHTRANAVDIRFSGNVEDTVKFIKEASAEGVGGIGVYGPGRVHLDTESKRVWGPDFTARSIPEWAKPALDAHMGKKTAGSSGSDAEAVAAEPATPTMAESTSGGTSGGSEAAVSDAPMEAPAAPEMVSADTGMGQAVTAASQENAIEERIPAPVTETVSDAGVSVPNSAAGAPTYAHSPDEPGNVEPEDAVERYAKLFDMAA